MTPVREQTTRLYREALAEYAESGSEEALANAYDLGRRMLAARVEILDLVTEHSSILQTLLHDRSADESAAIHERALSANVA